MGRDGRLVVARSSVTVARRSSTWFSRFGRRPPGGQSRTGPWVWRDGGPGQSAGLPGRPAHFRIPTHLRSRSWRVAWQAPTSFLTGAIAWSPPAWASIATLGVKLGGLAQQARPLLPTARLRCASSLPLQPVALGASRPAGAAGLAVARNGAQPSTSSSSSAARRRVTASSRRVRATGAPHLQPLVVPTVAVPGPQQPVQLLAEQGVALGPLGLQPRRGAIVDDVVDPAAGWRGSLPQGIARSGW